MRLKRDSLDAAFSDYIRWRDRWICRRCGSRYAPPTQGLHCAHIYTRANPSIRVDEDNALALCHGCHSYFTGRPIVFKDWCEETLGVAHMEKLKIKYYARSRKITQAEKGLMRRWFLDMIEEMKEQA